MTAAGRLKIDVQVYGGSHIPDAIREMIVLATRMKIDVWAELNGVRTLARPRDNADALIEAWQEAADNGHKHASTGSRT